jgi:predicted O-methyltransferase YrrM
VHFLFFAALAEKKLKIYNILEFGTYLGETTKYLSKLFKNSDIYTIDLPNNDPLLKDTYSRNDNKSFETYTRVQSDNLMNKNIYSYSLNTLFLGSENRIISKKYDLIWLDAGHNFPEIAWDFSYALSLVSKQGFIVIDDVILNNKVFNTDYVSNHSFLLIEYLKKRLDIELDFILKRSCPKRFYHINTRKYIAIIKIKS